MTKWLQFNGFLFCQKFDVLLSEIVLKLVTGAITETAIVANQLFSFSSENYRHHLR